MTVLAHKHTYKHTLMHNTYVPWQLGHSFVASVERSPLCIVSSCCHCDIQSLAPLPPCWLKYHNMSRLTLLNCLYIGWSTTIYLDWHFSIVSILAEVPQYIYITTSQLSLYWLKYHNMIIRLMLSEYLHCWLTYNKILSNFTFSLYHIFSISCMSDEGP